MLGALFATLSAACFGFNNASARRGVLSGTALQGLAISIPLGLAFFFVCAVAFGQWGELGRLSAADIGFLAAGGFAHFIWGRYFNIRSLAAVGSNLAGPVQQVGQFMSLSLAVFWLGETLNPLKVVGILLVLSAPSYILHMRSRQRARARAEAARRAASAVGAAAAPGEGGAAEAAAKPVFTPRMAEGYAMALLAALGFGSSPVLVKAGLQDTGLSLVGGFISYGAAMVCVAVIMLLPGRIKEMREINRFSLKWFTISGFFVSLSQVLRYVALGLAPVTVVGPIQATSLLWRMVWGFAINRDHELFDRYVLIGLALSMTGVICLSLSNAAVLALADAPGWLGEVAAWRWPAP